MDFQLVFWIALGVLAFLMLRQVAQHRKPFKTLAFGTLSGLLTLFPVSYFLGQAGITLAINGATLAVAGVLGIPGVAGLVCFTVLF